jgi:hypothetical protein
VTTATTPPATSGVGALTIERKTKGRRFPPKKNARAQPAAGFAFEPNDECKEELSWPEVKGAASAAIDKAINQALANDGWFFTHKEDLHQLETCLVGERSQASRGYEVLFNDKGILAVRETSMARYEGGTHSWDPGPERWLAFDTTSGARLTWKDLLATSKTATRKTEALLDRCARSYVRDVNGNDPSALADVLEKVTFANGDLLVLPTASGLHFAALGYAPPARVLEGEGPTIRWSALVAAGVLRTDGPAARLAEGVAPATPTDDPCADPNAKR